MSDAEGLMWRLEEDPSLSSTIANITVLDRPPEADRLRRTMERACQVIPRLRQRVQAAPLGVGSPTWVDDSSFDLAYHLRRVALPSPATQRELENLAMLVVADPFDRARPLWEFIVVEGLADGNAAIIQKFHHTVTDGEGGVRLSLEFLDFERDPPERQPVEATGRDLAVAGSPDLDVVRDLLVGSLRFPLVVLRQVRELLSDPAGIPRAGAAMAETLRTIVTELAATDRARSPLWTARSLARAYETLDVPLAPVREAAKALGGTVNAAFIAAAAAAAGEYHRLHGHCVEELRASMAVSTRTADSGANAFSLARLLVPTGEMAMAERVGLVVEATAQAKEASRTGALDVLAAVANTLPTPLVTRIVRTHAQTVDFATSNVRASPTTLYVGGAKVLASYPVGPLVGVAFNVTTMSYGGALGVGLHCDTAAVTEPGVLKAALIRAFEQLVAAATS
jgi:diacylglycerol O-acyltransferase / wax synthase